MNEEIIKLRTGEVIVNEGEHSSDFFILKEGEIAVFKGIQKIAEIKETETLLGEMSFFLEDQRSATMIAQSDVKISKIKKENILEHIKDDPEFALKIAKSLAIKLSETTEKITELNHYRELYDKIANKSENYPQLEKLLKEAKEQIAKKEEKVKDMLNKGSIMSQKIVEPLIKATIESVNKMLNTQTTVLETFEFHEKKIEVDIASIIEFKKDLNGYYIIGFSKEVAYKMTTQITQEENKEINNYVISFIKEINNVIIGWIISLIKGYNLDITTPTMIFGSKSIKNMIGKKPCVVIPFNTHFGKFYTITYLEFIE
jgi:CRP-like cAMP-binding protein